MKVRSTFVAYAAWMAALAFFLWLNQEGNVLVSLIASLAVLGAIRVRSQ